MKSRRIRTSLTALIAAIAFAIIASAAMVSLFTDTSYAIEPDNTNYALKAVPTAQGLDKMPGVYTVKATVNTSANNPLTIGIPSVAKQNLTPDRGATKELPAIIMGAAVNYEVRTGPTEFTPIEGAELVAPYSYFRWGVMEEETKEADGSITTHRKLSGFDGSYYIVRVDVSEIIEAAKANPDDDLTGKFLHVRQQNNKALLVATGMTDNSYVYADTSQTNNKGGCKIAAYPLDNDAEAMKDTTGADKETPYLDVIVMSSAKNVAGADAGTESAPVSNVDLSFYVDDTKDYKPWLHALDPNNMPTFPYTPEGSPVTYADETAYNTALTTKFFDEEKAAENGASYFKVMGEDLEIDVAIDNNEEVSTLKSTGEQSYRSINWLAEKMDFWSMEHAIAHEGYDDHTIILICEVPVLDSMNISGKNKRSVILDVNSFDIQIANNTEQDKAGLTIGKNAQLRIKDGSNTAGAELAIGNNATMVIEDGGVMVIDETCTAEAEYDAASTVDPSQTTPTEYLSGEITVKSGGKIINQGVINIEGTEGKPLDPAQQDPVIRDKKCADILVEYGGEMDNYGCLSLKGVLYIMGTLNNYGQYNDILTAYDPDKNKIDYHRGIQVTWKDDVTQEGVEPGVLNVGIDANGTTETRAVLNNYGDIVIVPGTFNLYGTFNNEPETDGYAGHLYLCTVTEAIIPIVDPNDPLIVEKRVRLKEPRESVFNNKGVVNNKGVIDSAKVELIHNGVMGGLVPSDTVISTAAEGVKLAEIAVEDAQKAMDELLKKDNPTKEEIQTAYNKVVEAQNTLAAAQQELTAAEKAKYKAQIAELDGKVSEMTEEIAQLTVVDISNYAATLEKTSYEYTGKEIKPAVTVSGLKADDYTVTYSNNTAIGTAKVTIEGKADKNFSGKIEKTFEITKRSNVVNAKVSKKTYKAKKLQKKARSFNIAGVIKVSGAKGKVTYTASPVNAKSKKALKFKNGKVTVKKKTKKGTYKMKVTVKDAGTNIDTPATKTVTLTVRVK